MGVKVRWTDPALKDLDGVLGFIAAENPDAAKTLWKKAKAATRSLRRYPMKGRMVPEYQDPLVRELIVGPCRILYSTSAYPVLLILAIVRAERTLDSDFPGFLC